MKRSLPLLALGALLLLFALGATQLYSLRLQRGDVYPISSSLRADPLGAKALHDALAQMSRENREIRVERNYAPLSEFGSEPRATLFVLGAQWRDRIEAALRAAREGHRVVLTFSPAYSASEESEEASNPRKSRGTKRREKEKTQKEEKEAFGKTSSATHLAEIGLTPKWNEEWQRSNRSTATPAQPGLEPSLNWGGTAFLEISEKQAARTKVLYERDGKPVMVEMPLGLGSIVVATDAYFLSNEALYVDRPAKIISYLLGSSSRMVFDEAHLGVQEQRGIAWLIREYRLFGVVLVAGVIALLFLWKEALPLLPQVKEDEELSDAPPAITKESGFVLLLRRSISPARILGVCVEEWNKTFSHRQPPLPIPERGTDPLREYTRISNTIPRNMR